MKSDMFLRFVVARKDADSSKREGVFTPAYRLLKSGALAPDPADRLDRALSWFQLHLPLPDRSRITPRGIFWYKADAEDLVRRMWEIANVLEAAGVAVELIRATKPGYVLYEDRYQVCAVPFRDTGA